MGLDIIPGYSPRSKRVPRYAVVITRNGEVVAKFDSVPLYRVIRLIIEHHVDIIAVDNIYELAKSTRDIAKLSKLIPSWCKIVEVTWTPSGYRDVESLAREQSLPAPGDPLTTALVNALLAERGFGKEIKLHADRVYIIVSKGRTPVQGGSSSDRFKRSIRASVLQAVKEIKEVLDENELDYDLVVKESEGGLERGFFIVYAPLERVQELVSRFEHKNIKVKIEPGVHVSYSRESKKKVILGIDPGINVGIAVLDLEGKPLLVKSYKTPDRELIIESILAIGKPIIVSVDVEKPPEYVKKISSLLDAILFTPEKDMSVDEKQKIVAKYTEKYNIEVDDSHARDALAAAIKAYGYFKPVIDEVLSKITGIDEIDKEEVITQVIRGKPLAEVLEEEFMKILWKNETKPKYTIQEKPTPTETTTPTTSRLHTRLVELKQMVKKLEAELARKDEEVRNLQLELAYLKKRPLGVECERKINQLQLEVETLSRLLEEKTRIIEYLRDKAALLEKLLIETASGHYTIACKSSSIEVCSSQPVYLDNPLNLNQAITYAKNMKTGIITPLKDSGLSWEEFRVPIVIGEVVLDLGNYVLVRSELLNEIKSLWAKIEELEDKERRERIRRLIREYQESRRKTE